MLGENLFNLRKAKKISQKEVSEYLGISRVTYTNYELNNREPNISALIKFSDFYNIPIDDLLNHKLNQIKDDVLQIDSRTHKNILNKLFQLNLDNQNRLLEFINILLKYNFDYPIIEKKEE